jgi:hypothetical protein
MNCSNLFIIDQLLFPLELRLKRKAPLESSGEILE